MLETNQRLAQPTLDFRWVCQACGKFTSVNASVDDLHDTSCRTWAVKVRPDKINDKWVLLPEAVR